MSEQVLAIPTYIGWTAIDVVILAAHRVRRIFSEPSGHIWI
jgi:hypothetical protein